MQNKTNQPNPATVAGYERKDANIRGILVFMSLVLVGCVLVYAAARILLAKFEQHAEQRDSVAAQSQVLASVAQPPVYFPHPREQPAPKEDLETFQARENGELNSYGWVDRQSGLVRIPIFRAMDLIIKKGLPTRDATNQSAAGRISSPFMVGTSRCDVPARVSEGGTGKPERPPSRNIDASLADRSVAGATLGDGDGAARRPYQDAQPATGPRSLELQQQRPNTNAKPELEETK